MGLIRLLDGFDRLTPYGVWHGGITLWQVFLYYFLMICFLIPQIPKKILLFLFCLCILSIGWREGVPSKTLTVNFLDVGKGISSVIELPNGKVWVLEGGKAPKSDFDVGRYVVAPFLWQKNIRKIDALILSNPDCDPDDGLDYLIENFSPEIICWRDALEERSLFAEGGVTWQFLDSDPKSIRGRLIYGDWSLVYPEDFRVKGAVLKTDGKTWGVTPFVR